MIYFRSPSVLPDPRSQRIQSPSQISLRTSQICSMYNVSKLNEYSHPQHILTQDGRNTDVIFVCSDSRGVSGHKFVLAATCPLLCKLFSLDISRGTCPESLEAQVTKSKSLDSILHVKFGSSTVCPSVNSSYKLVDQSSIVLVLKLSSHLVCNLLLPPRAPWWSTRAPCTDSLSMRALAQTRGGGGGPRASSSARASSGSSNTRPSLASTSSSASLR